MPQKMHNVPLDPVIKWPGSKRSVALHIAPLIPPAERYFEPFVGGGALLPFRKSKVGIAGDIVPELIELWKAIRDQPELTAHEYEKRWKQLRENGYEAYYVIRESFNATRNPHDLLFLTRTCVNGLVRFNKNGEFNNSLHHTRPGILPTRLRRIIYMWSYAVNGVEFLSANYHETLSQVRAGDFVFLDPPYAGTRGRYMPNQFSINDFILELDRLNKMGVRWILTFDGAAGGRAYVTNIPSEVYKIRLNLYTGNSPFPRLMRTSVDHVVESVYLNFEPSLQVLNKLDNGRQQIRSDLITPKVHQNILFGTEFESESNVDSTT